MTTKNLIHIFLKNILYKAQRSIKYQVPSLSINWNSVEANFKNCNRPSLKYSKLKSNNHF